MKKKLSLLHCSYFIRCWIFFFVSILYFIGNAQSDSPPLSDTTLRTPTDTSVIAFPTDSLAGITQDSILIDSTNVKRHSPNAIEQLVTYDASDSIVIDIKGRKAHLFKSAVVYYEDMELHADYIEIDFKNNELYASGVATPEGVMEGLPYFIQGGATFWAHEIKYNFTTKKGKITSVITTEGEGFIHGKSVKKMEDCSYIQKGKYTTCELDHPHFQINFGKAKVIPGDKIITGPAYVSFVGIPTPVAIPFSYVPNKSGRSSGLVMPTFGESSNRGFYFENLGYYFGISDNFDLLIGGDIYTRGSWAVKALSNYVFRYNCSGYVEMSYAQNIVGERYTADFRKNNDFKIKWTHNQDPKFHPTTRFTADITIMSSSFNKYNHSSAGDYLSNQYNSTITFSTNIRNFFYFDAALSYFQNTHTRIATISLPNINMRINKIHPFRKKGKSGALKWYDNISLEWSSQFNNSINSYDSLLLKSSTWKDINISMQHKIPFTIPIKIAKLINWNTSATFTETWYMQSIEKEFITYIDSSGSRTGVENDIFKRGFNALHGLSLSSSFSTKVYFMYQLKKGKLKAVRHVMTPTLDFTYSPNINGVTTGSYFNPITGRMQDYSFYEHGTYGYSTISANNTQANLRLSIGNNLEMKVASKKDTVTGTRKVVILESFSASMHYNFAADSLNWSMLSLTGRTTLFKQLSLTFNIEFDPYCRDSLGNRTRHTEWEVNRKLLRFSSTGVTIGLNWRLDKNTFSGKKKEESSPETNRQNRGMFTENTLGMPNTRPDFDNPWSLTLNYTFHYNMGENMQFYNLVNQKKYTTNIVHSINIMGDVSITKKWKLGFSTNYDLVAKELGYTSFDIYRDLHCWEMRFNWIPFGDRKGFSFTINVKASVLQDAKLNLKQDFRDNF